MDVKNTEINTETNYQPENEMPNYQKIFGNINFKEADEARSVYSPAAYLTDLLQLIDDEIKAIDKPADDADDSAQEQAAYLQQLHQRREDIQHLLLDNENTFELLPYLDIVNERLEARVADLTANANESDALYKERIINEAYAKLKAAKFPFELPFDLHNERVKLYAKYLSVSPVALYKSITPEVDAKIVARESLGLSESLYQAITTTDASDEVVAQYYGNQLPDLTNATSIDAALFKKTTRLSHKALEELLLWNLSAQELVLTKAQPSDFNISDTFLNQGLGGIVSFNDDESQLVWQEIPSSTTDSDGDDAANAAKLKQTWFARAYRFIRLANASGLTFTQLELALRTCCNNILDEEAITSIAMIKHFAANFDIKIDEACALISTINNHGFGEDEDPADLFNRVFNGICAKTDKRYLGHLEPEQYLGFTRIEPDGKILDLGNKDYRNRIARALSVSQKQLEKLITGFHSRRDQDIDDESLHQVLWTFEQGTASAPLKDIEMLATLYRSRKICEYLDWSIEDLFNVLDVVEQDPLVMDRGTKHSFINQSVNQRNGYEILLSGSVTELQWLMQTLAGTNNLLLENDISSEDLLYITCANYPRALQIKKTDTLTAKPTRAEKAAKADIATFNKLYQKLKAKLLTPVSYKSRKISERLSRISHAFVTQKKGGLVSNGDARLAHSDKTAMADVIEHVIANVDSISKEDFIGLGLQEKVAAKIFDNLLLIGYLNVDGTLKSDYWPLSADNFYLETDFNEKKQVLFDAIADRHSNYVDAAFHPSDFETLGLSKEERNELIDNLAFNGYLDESGQIVEKTTFEARENISLFEVNSNIGIHAEEVFAFIQNKVEQFKQAKVKITAAAFEALPLSENEIKTLIRNLTVNEYLTDDFYVKDNEKMLAVTETDFLLEIQFYPHRKQILSAILAGVEKVRSGYTRFDREHFETIADKVVAGWAYSVIEQFYLDNQRLTPEAIEFFRNNDNAKVLDIHWPFSENDNNVVFKRIQAILKEVDSYRFTEKTLSSLNFADNEYDELVSLLIAKGELTSDWQLVPEKVAFFQQLDNALTYELTGFEDYNKDVFFLLHALAKKVADTAEAITASHEKLAMQQQSAIYQVLAEAFSLDEKAIIALSEEIFADTKFTTDHWILPLLRHLDASDKISSAPEQRSFNVSFRRIKQFAKLAEKLKLDSDEIAIVFRDQTLVDKFPVDLALPTYTLEPTTDTPDAAATTIDVSVTGFDALLQSSDGYIYIFKNAEAELEGFENDYARYWQFSAVTGELIDTENDQLSTFLTGDEDSTLAITNVQAAFVDKLARDVLIIDNIYYYRDAMSEDEKQQMQKMLTMGCVPEHRLWQIREREWGKTLNDFKKMTGVDAAFTDQNGNSYLFNDGHYVRYSPDENGVYDYNTLDADYPRNTLEQWHDEGISAALHDDFTCQVDAALHGSDDISYFFKEDYFVSSQAPQVKQRIGDHFGNIKNNLAEGETVDACFTMTGITYAFSGDQIFAYRDSLENASLQIIEGYPLTIKEFFEEKLAETAILPPEYLSGIDAAFFGEDSLLHLFKEEKTLTVNFSDKSISAQSSLKETWGNAKTAEQLKTITVDAALAGVDGRIYIFSGDQYYRYSAADYAKVDDGYPRAISENWQGLDSINAAFIMDGKTYLFGRKDHSDANDVITVDAEVYVCFSGNDYSEADLGYPKLQDEVTEYWWNLPEAFAATKKVNGEDVAVEIDAIFNAPDKKTYLFAGTQYLIFDHINRWWSEPKSITADWPQLGFETIDAAFSGKDGKTYIFSGNKYVCFSDAKLCKVDHGYPKTIGAMWGKTEDPLNKCGSINAAVSLSATEYKVVENGSDEEDKEQIVNHYTYLFSSKHYYRYVYSASTGYVLDSGYPRTIETFRNEPRFKYLDAKRSSLKVADSAWLAEIDAIVADERNVYFFDGQQVHVVADVQDKAYTGDANFADINCALSFEGAFYAKQGTQWHHLSAPETASRKLTTEVPALLAHIDESDLGGLNAVLQGLDDNTYLFMQDSYYDSQLNREYKIADKWGRVRNNIRDKGVVDAVLHDRDGKTYVFSGDQYVIYDTDIYVDQEVFKENDDDQAVHLISEDWFGLNNVDIAYVLDDKTYLFEKPDSRGHRRYLCLSDCDLAEKAGIEVQISAGNFWDMPYELMAQGWGEFDALLVDNHTSAFEPVARKFKTVKTEKCADENQHSLIFINNREFVQFNTETGHWSTPASLDKLWSDLPCEHVFFDELTSVFVRDDKVYFFAQHCYRISAQNTGDDQDQVARTLSEATKIAKDWGKVAPRLEHIDATFVYQGRHTYLFSGGEYIRYSGKDYCHLPEGYPKAIAEDLRKEPGFKHLPQNFEAQVSQKVAADQPIIVSAALTNDQNIYLFMDDLCLVIGSEKRRDLSLLQLAYQQNTFALYGKIDAAFRQGEQTYLFSGDQYLKFSGCSYQHPDAGYPKKITDNFVKDFFGAQAASFTLPDAFSCHLDAALSDNQAVYLFKDKAFITLAIGETEQVIEGNWGEVSNDFLDSNGAVQENAIDGAFVDDSGYLYVIKGTQVIRYLDTEQEHIESGYPKALTSQFEQLPPAYQNGIDGAFTYAGNTYLFKNDSTTEKASYVSYHNGFFGCLETPAMPGIYPALFSEKWRDLADYRLEDIATIGCFKMLVEDYGSDITLVDLLRQDQGYVSHPYEMLADLFDWDVEALKWLKRHNAFLPEQVQDERRFDLELLCRIHDIFTFMNKIDADVSSFYSDFWLERFSKNDDNDAADYLLGLLGSKYCGDSSQDVLIKEMHDHLNLQKRNALLPYVIENNDRDILDARDLYEDMLIDVNMSECMETSRIKEAISALQLYFHRYFIGLESAQLIDEDKDGYRLKIAARRERLKERWLWMKNYRVWEANRKVFLYPENYIRPELRDTKTPEFAALEEKLLQGDLTEGNIATAINGYVNQFSTVSQLTVSGGYVYSEPDSPQDKKVILFGRTKSQPEMYYSRIGTFVAGRSDAVQWQPWLSVDIQIDAQRVYPVYALNRHYVFWAKIEEKSDVSSASSSKFEKKGENFNARSNVHNSSALSFYYSYTDLNGQWVPAQKLAYEIPSNDNIIGSLLDFSDIQVNSKNEIDHIEVKCLYTSEREIKPVADSNGQIAVQELIELIKEANDDNTDYVYFKAHSEKGSYYLTDEPDSSGPTWHATERSLRAKKLLPGEELSSAYRYQIRSKKEVNDDKENDSEFYIHGEFNEGNSWWNAHYDNGWLGSLLSEHNSSCTIRYLFNLEKSTVKAGYSIVPHMAQDVSTDDLRLIVDTDDDHKVKYVPVNSLDTNEQRLRTVVKVIANRKELQTSFRFYPESKKVATVTDSSGKIGSVEKSLLSRGLKTFGELFPNEDSNNLNQAILLNSPKNDSSLTWACFDYKGASFMCKPVTGATGTLTPVDINLPTALGSVNSAVNIGDNTWLFDNNGNFIQTTQTALTEENVAAGDLPAVQTVTDVWGKAPSSWASVDAAFVQGTKTHLIKGEEYISYPNGRYNEIPQGYPKSLATNSEKLPKANVDAAFRAAGVNYFIRGEKWYKIDTIGQEVEMTGSLWPAGSELGTASLLPSQAKAYLKINGVGYGIGQDNRLVKLTNDPDTQGDSFTAQCVEYFPSVTDFAYSSNKSAFVVNSEFYNITSGGTPYHETLPTSWGAVIAVAACGDNSWTYIIYKSGANYYLKYYNGTSHSSAKLITTKTGQSIDNIFYLNNKFYIVAGNEYYNFTSMIGLISLNRTADGTLDDLLGSAKVLSAFSRDGQVFVMSKTHYIKITESELADGTPSLPSSATALAGNNDGLKTDVGTIEAAFYGSDLVTRFFGTSNFITGETNASAMPIEGNWGKLKNNLQDASSASKGRVDAAFSQNGKLFLISGDQYYRYDINTLDIDNPVLDAGYPKLIANNVEGINNTGNFDFAFTLGGKEQAYYISKTKQKNVPSLNLNWGNSSAYDLAYNVGIDKLFVINGATGALVTDPATIVTDEDYTGYDVIRLSSMAGSKLSQIIFNKGAKGVISLDSQYMDEAPRFELTSATGANTQEAVIQATPLKVSPQRFPVDSHLEFKGANGQYYWELFYHVPSLIAQSLNNAQQFEQAKAWYECIYDPTLMNEYWQFIPFTLIDIAAINKQLALIAQGPLGVDEDTVAALTGKLVPYIPFFTGKAQITPEKLTELESLRSWSTDNGQFTTWTELATLRTAVKDKLQAWSSAQENGKTDAQIIHLRVEALLAGDASDTELDLADSAREAIELLDMITRLYSRYKYLQTGVEQVKTYLDDPFDPHAIAALRINAYRRTTVMAYVDNLLDWGDHLFRRYSRESIGEARMLYVLVHDLLGKKPENLGERQLPLSQTFENIRLKGADTQATGSAGAVTVDIDLDREDYDVLFDAVDGEDTSVVSSLSHSGTVHESVANPYFFVPENTNIIGYWGRVEDRLHKIRHCLNIEGVKQPLPLFQPPIDPMQLVNAVAAGGSLQAALEGMNMPVPHYRFNFMLNKAREIVGKASQLGNELLGAIEKKDAEELSQMQTKHESQILEMTQGVKLAQIEEIGSNIANLRESMESATQQLGHYDGLVSEGMITSEEVQVGMMTAASVMFVAIPIIKFAGAVVSAAAPDVKGGPPTTIGATKGGTSIGAGLTFGAEALESIAEGISMGAEVAGLYAQHQRSVEDWKQQATVTKSEIDQIEYQLRGANWQLEAAQKELSINEKEQDNNASVMTFMKDKFSNKQLYQWMSSKLSSLYYQTYNMAHDFAKVAEVAYRYERGVYSQNVNFIGGHYWDNAKKGLLAGDSLAGDLDQMEQAYIDTNKRALEITKTVSLMDIDPMAFFTLKKTGVCEFSFKEDDFNYDFPGHYCRQIKTLAVKLNAGEGKTVFATLTQLNNKTLLAPDVKAVKYLMSPKDLAPAAIRSDWRSSQQIAVSQADAYSGQSTGLFELNFGDERYLPFEGTGAISKWRLELAGKKGSYDVKELQDLEIELKYTAKQGGEDFADAVRGLLKPYDSAVQLDIAKMFPQAFYAFVHDDSDELKINITREMLPNLSGSKVNGIYPFFEMKEDSALSLVMNGDDELKLKNQKLLFTNGLSIGRKGETWTFKAKGKKSALTGLSLVLGYKAKVV